MAKRKLTDLAIKKLNPARERRLELPDPEAHGLYVCIQPSGAKSFAMRFRRPDGRNARLVLGGFDATKRKPHPKPEIGADLKAPAFVEWHEPDEASLVEARLLAGRIHHERASGADVIANRKADKLKRRFQIAADKDNAFSLLARRYFEDHARHRTRRWIDAARYFGLAYREDAAEPTVIANGLCDRWADRPMPQPARRRLALPMDLSFGATDEADQPLPVAGFKGTSEEIERQWYEQVYRGHGDSMVQLTWRAVLMGSCLGAVLSLTNLYIGLKAGWGFGVAITASILSYAIWTSLLKVGIARTPMTILENNCMQSTASSAGYSTGGTLISAFAAYIIINHQFMSVPLVLAWVFFIAALGVTMAIPMKRQMINIEQLRFPSGIAAAETLRALHAKSSRGLRAAKALGLAGLIAAIDKFWAEGLSTISANLERFSSEALLISLQKWLLGSHYAAWSGRTVIFSWDFIFVAAGAIIGMRVCATVLVSGTLCWAVVVPILQTNGVIEGAGFAAIVQWTLWFGASCMVAAGLLNFALSWRTALRAFRDLGQLLSFRSAAASERSRIEAPMSWFAVGQIVSLVALAWLGHASFGMPVWQSAIAVALSFLLALVACRVTGETDTTPVGAMGKVTQLAFGALSPGNVNVNLMSANITAGAATSAADLLTDLKSGYLLGANPRQQFLAQFAGIFVGTIVSVLTFAVLVPNAQVLGTDQFPAPAAQIWSAVAIALGQGLSSLEAVKLWLIFAGGVVGVVLTLAPVLLPKYQEYLPSASAFGLAWVFNWYYGLLFFLGALVALLIERREPKVAEEFTLPLASGVVAGGSLMGVALVFWANGGVILSKLFGD